MVEWLDEMNKPCADAPNLRKISMIKAAKEYKLNQ